MVLIPSPTKSFKREKFALTVIILRESEKVKSEEIPLLFGVDKP